MAWKPFSNSAPTEPTPARAVTDVPVLDSTQVELTPSGTPDTADSAVADERDSAEHNSADQPLEATTVLPVVAADEPADPAPVGLPRLGGATKYSSGESADAPVEAPAEAADAVVTQPDPEPADVAPVAPVARDTRGPAHAMTPDVADDLDANDPVSAEQARLDRERAARREARMAALAPVREDDPLAVPAPAAAKASKPVKPTTDRFFGSLALFALRAVTAAIVFVHGLNGLLQPAANLELWSNTVLPYPRYIALGVSAAEVAVAILLLFGLMTRLAGLVLLGLMAGILTFVMWGSWSVFEPGGAGFIGEQQLLLATVGLVFLLLGAGGWSVDKAIRSSRAKEGIEI